MNCRIALSVGWSLACLCAPAAAGELPEYLMLLRQDGAVAKADIARGTPPYVFSLLNQATDALAPEIHAVDLAVHEGGFYVLDRRGPIYSFGRGYGLSYGLDDFVLDQPVACDLEFLGHGPEAVMVDELGRVYQLLPGRPVNIILRSPTLGWAPIRDMEIEAGARILLDAQGGVYRQDAATPFLQFPVRRDDEAEDLALAPDGSYYLLTSHGLVYAASRDGRPAVVLPTAYLPGEIARTLVPTRVRPGAADSHGGGFWILDAYGTVYAYGDAPSVAPYPSVAPDWVDLVAVYADDLRPRPQPPPQMEVALLPAAATLSTLSKRLELSVQVRGARDLAGFAMKLQYDPRLLSASPSEVVAGRDFARVGLDPVVSGLQWGATDELLVQGSATVDEGKGISGRVEVARLPFGILASDPVATSVAVVTFKAIDTAKGSGWVDAASTEPSRLFLRTKDPTVLLSLSPSEEQKRGTALVGEPFPVYVLAQDWRDVSGVQFDLDYGGAGLMDLGYDEGDLLLRGDRWIRLDLDTAGEADAARGRRRQRVGFLSRDQVPVGNGVLLAFYYRPLEPGRATLYLRNVSLTDSLRRRDRSTGLSDQVVVDVLARRPVGP